MKILWFCVILHTVFADYDFGSPLLKDNRLCQSWSCINTKLGLSDGLPPKDQYTNVLKALLPAGAWQETVSPVVDACYGDKPRRYTNTCSGQALMHCIVDNLIQNCPEESLRKDDACAPLSSLAGFKYMFSQSRYENLENNLPKQNRPTWFLKNYFSSKCCDLPPLFNSTTLQACGFHSIVHFYTHTPRHTHAVPFNSYHREPNSLPPQSHKGNGDTLQVVDISLFNEESTPRPNNGYSLSIVQPNVLELNNDIDPLDCCNLSEFIAPTWRSDCDFHLTWEGQDRLTIGNQTRPVSTTTTTTTAKPLTFSDVTIVPQSCEQENCVFRKLNIVSETGEVDKDAFLKLLDNMTSVHTSWTKAKARVVTNCLTGNMLKYSDNCEINRLLSCTVDVLSENCPSDIKHDPCKRRKVFKNGTICQINSSKYRPKNRRQFCSVPNLVNHEVLSECGINSLMRLDYVDPPTTNKPSKFKWWKSRYMCKDTTDTTKCVLSKMAVLTKYNFMDYFKMKDRIRQSSQGLWTPLTETYLGAFSTMPLYREHCSTPKKLLNVLDSMILTCPSSKRKRTPECTRLFSTMANTKIKSPFPFPHSPFWTLPQTVLPSYEIPYKNGITAISLIKPKTEKPFNSVILNSDGVPPVRTMDIKPQVISQKPIVTVLLPVYLRPNGQGKGALSIRPYSDGVLRSDPFELHKKIARAHSFNVTRRSFT